MTTDICEQLDDFLADELGEHRRTAFETHLLTCTECRRAVEDNDRVNRLLTDASEQLEAHSATLVDRIEQRIGAARLRRRFGIGLTIAASLVGLLAWLSLSARRDADQIAGENDVPKPIEQHDPHRDIPQDEDNQQQRSPHELVTVRFDPASNVLAVPVESGNPNVTILRVYPTLKAAQATADPQPLEFNTPKNLSPGSGRDSNKRS